MDERREQKLKALARSARSARLDGAHLGEPLLALIRSGDHDADLADALVHAARCPDCRARLLGGEVGKKAVVVVAIEGPRTSQAYVERAAHDVHARLYGRGAGRWTAVVDAEKSESLAQRLDRGESSVVTRLAMAKPVDVPLERTSRRSLPSLSDAAEVGFTAAEVQAWAQAATAPRRHVNTGSISWVVGGIIAISCSAAVAYWLATR